MMTQTFRKGRRGPAILPKLLAALSVVACFGLPTAFAGGDGGNSNPGVPSAGDEVTTLPLIATEDTGGTILVGKPLEIERLVRTARGQGTVRVLPRSDGDVVVAFRGDWVVRFDRAELETTPVRILFAVGSTFQDGHARLAIGGDRPLSLLLDRPYLEMPLSNLARGDFQGIGWDLTAVGLDGPVLRNVALFRDHTVSLFQRASF